MAKYRKVDVRIWNDEKFRALTDDGKLMFFYLLTHPNMTAIGAMRASVPGIAAELEWPIERCSKAFAEGLPKAFRDGLWRHDEKALAVWLPKFARHNPPENPNVIKAWVGAVDNLPECDITTLAIQTVKDFAKGYGKAYAEAFENALAKHYPKGMPNRMPKQEQEQEQDLTPPPPLDFPDQATQQPNRPPRVNGHNQKYSPTAGITEGREQALTRLAKTQAIINETRNAPAAPMSDSARQAVEKLRKAARISDTSDPPPIEPDDIPFDRNEEPASAGANP